ncbi:MAG: hypothetical protein IPK42_02135 [Betaproteobacteria bacterium]|jgi:hypothetical protein|nr:hypothetical protein [Betaproteobacteria bacterium]
MSAAPIRADLLKWAEGADAETARQFGDAFACLCSDVPLFLLAPPSRAHEAMQMAAELIQMMKPENRGESFGGTAHCVEMFFTSDGRLHSQASSLRAVADAPPDSNVMAHVAPGVWLNLQGDDTEAEHA